MWVAFLIAVGLFLMVVVAATMGEAWFFPIGDGWGIEWDGMGAVVGMVALFVGAIPALAIAWVAYRMPR